MNHIDTYLSAFKPKIAQLDQIINDNQSFLLVGHRSPDGDCIGSMLGFGKWLNNKGKQTHYIVPTPYPQSLSRMTGIEKIKNMEDNQNFPHADIAIYLDLGAK